MDQKLRELQQTFAETKTAATKILDEHKDGLTAEQREEYDKLFTALGEQKTAIEGHISDQERRASIGAMHDFMDKPRQVVAHGGLNGDDTDRKALMGAGWEIKNQRVFAPTSIGPVEMYHEDVLFGAAPSGDADAAEYYKTTRAIFNPIYRQAYERYLRNSVKMRSESMAYSALSDVEQKALAEGTDTSGGFLVPPDVQAEMLVRLPQFAVMRRFARVQTTSRDILRWPRVQPHGSSGSIYSSGFVGSWVGETPAFSDTDPGFGTFDIPIKKLRVATKLSNDLIADAAVNILAFLAQNGAENMGLTEDSGFITGDGTGLYPLGILNGVTSTVDVEGSTSNTISNTTSSLGSASKLITNVVYALPSQYAERAVWLMRRSIEGKIRILVDAQNRFMWPMQAGSMFGPVAMAPGGVQLSGGPMARLLMDFPVYNSEFMPTDGTDTNKVLVFGDLSAYVIGQRAQVTTVVLRERFADTDQVGIILFERVGGALWNSDAVRVGVV